MTASTTTDVDVLIIGMGPVGKLAALLLARAGHSVIITDRKADTYRLPRAVAHDAEIARILQSAGLSPNAMPDAVEPYDDMYTWVNGEGEVLHQVDWTGIDPSGWNNTYFYNQPALEGYLEEQLAAAAGVRTVRGVAAAVLDQDEHSVTGVLTDLGDGTTTELRARYALGADGANSGVRSSLGIEWHDLGYFFDWLVVDVLPKEQLPVASSAIQVCDPARPTTVVPGGPGRRRWEFMRLENETKEELTRPERIWQLLERFGVTEANASLERGVVYTFNSGWAEQWRKGRVLLLGDAAHLMPPFAGQGLAAGFRDCLNLMWKLDRVLAGSAPQSLLDSYESERLDHVKEFIEFSMSLGRIICITDVDEARARDEQMMKARAQGTTPEPPPEPRLGPGLHRGEHGGHLSWQGQVTTATTTTATRFDDVFGHGALIIGDPELARSVDAATIEALAAAGIAVTAFTATDDVPAGVQMFDDVNGTYRSWLSLLDTGAVLVRQDFYVFGTARTVEQLRDLELGFLESVGGTTVPV
ncbi:bifunctional 3-(3-hydroxy-phenyl)propionate/3-hydroxycinnamic acid hydroxylase MhpA [Herbiconiux liukaitaii]|uniref:bifunctional 3-(3-hydroxy-phenyl)propionate/3-hydroxycinnamic acid hydroxylase MhpA n=1 Tax=Herbiconiux liukaitaii TaxID=3342799 RepID=UPI0035B80D23